MWAERLDADYQRIQPVAVMNRVTQHHFECDAGQVMVWRNLWSAFVHQMALAMAFKLWDDNKRPEEINPDALARYMMGQAAQSAGLDPKHLPTLMAESRPFYLLLAELGIAGGPNSYIGETVNANGVEDHVPLANVMGRSISYASKTLGFNIATLHLVTGIDGVAATEYLGGRAAQIGQILNPELSDASSDADKEQMARYLNAFSQSAFQVYYFSSEKTAPTSDILFRERMMKAAEEVLGFSVGTRGMNGAATGVRVGASIINGQMLPSSMWRMARHLALSTRAGNPDDEGQANAAIASELKGLYTLEPASEAVH